MIEALDLAANEALPVVERSGLAELLPVGGGTAPHVYADGGQWTQVATDANGTWSYWRLTAPITEVTAPGTSCTNDFKATYQLRLVMCVDREICPVVIDAARSVMSALRGADPWTLLNLRRTSTINAVRAEVDSARVYQQEFGQQGNVPPNKVLIAIDVTAVAIGRPECFEPCGPVRSLLCAAVASASWERIKACMTAGQIADAEDDLCEGGGPCDPTTVNGVEIDGQTVTITQGGVEVGTVNTATGEVVVPECPPTEVDVTVNDTAFGTATGSTFDVPVVDGTGTEVGSKVGPDWVVPTAKSLCQLVTEGTSAEVATCIASAGKRPGVLAELIPTVDNADVLAQIIDPLTPSQDAVVAVIVQLRDSAANNIGVADTYAPGTTTTKTAPDGSVQRRDSAGTAIGSAIPVRSGQTDVGVTCPDGVVTIRNSVPTTLHTVSVRSNGSATQAIADSTITRPDGTTVGLPATVALDVRDYRSGIAYNFGRILHSGQVAAPYRTGDEGSM